MIDILMFLLLWYILSKRIELLENRLNNKHK